MENTESSPKWLQKLQNESWQAEILISGGSIVALNELDATLGHFIKELKYSTFMPPVLEIIPMMVRAGVA